MGKTIMVADGSLTMRRLVSITLEGAGYEVVEASSGMDALEKLKGMDVEMVITDLVMPEMNGIELVRRLRNGGNFGLKPILMLTTESREDKKQEGRKAGANGWITKPFDQVQLLHAVKDLTR